MESSGAHNHLPPRKRLLAELRKQNSEFNFLSPVPLVLGDFDARLRDVVNSPGSTPEKIIEVSKSVALAAFEIAVAARNNAIEKAAAATKVKADAKNALLFLDFITMKRKSRKIFANQNKVSEKQIPIKLLYKTSRSAGSHETDEGLARKLHGTMNSSPTILDNSLRTNAFLLRLKRIRSRFLEMTIRSSMTSYFCASHLTSDLPPSTRRDSGGEPLM